MGDDGIMGDGMLGWRFGDKIEGATALMMELCASFCSDELLDPGLTVGSGSDSNLNLKEI